MKQKTEYSGKGSFHNPRFHTVSIEFTITGKAIDLELEFANDENGDQIGVTKITKEQLIQGIIEGKIQIPAGEIILSTAKEKELTVEITNINTVN